MHADVLDGLAEHWWPDRAHELQGHLSWVRANLFRPGPEPVTVRAGTGDATATLLCYVNGEPAAGEAYDLIRLLLGEPPVFEWTAAGRARLAGLRPALATALCPNVTVVLPGYRMGYLTSGRSSPGLAAAAVRGTLALAAERGAGAVGFLYVPRDARTLRDALRTAGFHPVALTSRAVLPVRWPDVHAYASSFSRHRRSMVRNELNRIARLGVESAPAEPGSNLDTMVRLRCAHLTKFGPRPDFSAERARFAAVLDSFPARDVRLVLAWLDGALVGCSLFVRCGRTVDLTLSASVPAAGRSLVQFEHSIYAPIRLGILQVGDQLDLGISHLGYKLLRGCRPVPLDAWVWVGDRSADAALRELSVLSADASVEARAEAVS